MGKNKLTTPNRKFQKGIVGIGIYEPKTGVNVGTLIRSAKMFGVDYFFTIGKRYKKQKSDTGLSDKIPVFFFETWEQFKNSIPPVYKITCIEMTEQSIPLSEYNVQKSSVFLLGSEDKGLPKIVLEDEKCEFVSIEGNNSLNVATAGTLVLYKNFIKKTPINN